MMTAPHPTTAALWADFFTALGYEHEAAPMGAEGLPRFYLPEIGTYAIVADERLSDEERDDLATRSASPGSRLLLEGPPENRAVPLFMPGEYEFGPWTDASLTRWHGYPQSEGRLFTSCGCDCAWEGGGCAECRFPDVEAAVGGSAYAARPSLTPRVAEPPTTVPPPPVQREARPRVRRKKRRDPRNIRKGVRFDVMKRDGYRCQLCGASAKDGVRLEIDHKVPVAKGGTADPSNLWVLCRPCNAGKSDKDL